MNLRIGPPGAERPVVRLDDEHYVDVSDVVTDFNECGHCPRCLSGRHNVRADR